MSFRPAAEQSSWPEDVLPFDRRQDVVGLESYKGWGPHEGPKFYKAYREEDAPHPDHVVRHSWRHPEGKYDHECARCRMEFDRVVRGHDYEQLWYRARYWFKERRPKLERKKQGFCSCMYGQSWAGKPDPGCPVHDPPMAFSDPPLLLGMR